MLTDVAVRKAAPKESPYKLSDAQGLYLLVKPNGTKLWRLKYRFGGKEKVLSFGRLSRGQSDQCCWPSGRNARSLPSPLLLPERDQRVISLAVCRLADRQVEGESSSPGISQAVKLTGEPAPRAAKSSSIPPPFFRPQPKRGRERWCYRCCNGHCRP